MKQTIESKLGEALTPAHLVVKDESHMHNVPDGAESHFNVFVVADAFEESASLLGTQAVYAVLKEELAGRIHALALKTITPAEWAAQGVQRSRRSVSGALRRTVDQSAGRQSASSASVPRM